MEKRVFTTGAVLPCQVVNPPVWPAEGSRKLMTALLDDALRCVSVDVHDESWREATRWMFSDDRAYPFSFLNVCDAVDMDPEWLRQVVRRVATRIGGHL
jgi:hypothetical protein